MEKKKNIKIEIKETNKNKKSKKHDDEDDIYEIDDDQDQKDNYFNIPEEEEYKDKNIHIEDEDKDLNELDNFPQEVEALNINLDMEEVSMRIKEITTSLTDFNSYKKNNSNAKNRSDLISELKQYCKIYYDYNEDIITLVMNLFAPNEAVEFLESSANQRIMSIRTNTLKIKRRELAKQLINRGVNLDPLAEWTKVGLKIYDSSVPIGATPEYLTGQYMLQSGSSFLPVMALEPKEGEKVLDMCAAPGGKTTYLAQLMKNTGVLVANDLKSDRIKSLYFNLHRLGVKNCIITNYDGTKICKQYNNFDRVLLDAPCSGLGVISKDPSVKVNRVFF